jgi:hypothetical protein
MDFASIPGGTYELGWRFTLPDRVRELADKDAVDGYIARCSVARKVDLAPFEIARQPIRYADLIGDPYDWGRGATLESLCDVVDRRLASDGLRLPSEDELEAAAGGALFPWGMLLPDGIPYGAEAAFVGHKEPSSFGLQLLGDPYKVELSRTALKFGDGGAAICGGDPWPLAWLALSPSFRLTDREIVDCFPETLEECYVRPVRRG